MKRFIIAALAALCALTACHEVEFIESSADRLGLTSLSAYFTSGPYEDQLLAKLTVTEESDEYVIPIPWYYPETSDDETYLYTTAMRVRAELQPNYKLSPALTILDLTEDNAFTLTYPDGRTRKINITGERVHSSDASLVTLMINEIMVNGIISKKEDSVLIPYLEDLSSVSVSAQVAAHAALTSIGGKKYSATGKYNMNEGSKVVVTADDGTERTYVMHQGEPTLLSSGINNSSIEQLFSVDPVSTLGFPDYTTKAYVSLAGLGNDIIVSFGSPEVPVLVNKFNGSKTGTLTLGSAVCDVLASDEGGHLLIANFAAAGETVNIYTTSSASVAPTLWHSFANPADVPVGHRMKVMGDITSDAIVTFTAEGIDEVTSTAKAVVLHVAGGVVSGEPEIVDFASYGFGWGSAPINTATIVPASLNPAKDGWFLDYYEGNVDPAIDSESGVDNYLLHYISGAGADKWMATIGNWGNNPNCLDSKNFNNSTYMALFVVSHFPSWGIGPRLYIWDVSTPVLPTLLASNAALDWTQTASYDGSTGASGDVAFCPSDDGFRIFIYYYDHHSHALGAYVADCISEE